MDEWMDGWMNGWMAILYTEKTKYLEISSRILSKEKYLLDPLLLIRTCIQEEIFDNDNESSRVSPSDESRVIAIMYVFRLFFSLFFLQVS